MIQIDRLVLGTEVENLLVEVLSLEGVDVDSKPEDPAHIATVGDATGQIRLVYRASTACRPTQVKKGKSYLVTGTYSLPFVTLAYQIDEISVLVSENSPFISLLPLFMGTS